MVILEESNMKLPAGESAYVPRDKITDYLLSLTHPVGCAKAVFFRAIGFDDSNTDLFESALLDIARNADVLEIEQKIYGEKYILEGPIHSPLNITRTIRTVWIVELNQNRPRFITAYPAEDNL
jgi:hypothetical protein